MHDTRADVREQVILALGSSRDERCIDLLAPLLASGDPKERLLAVHALGDIGGARADALLEATFAGPEQATLGAPSVHEDSPRPPAPPAPPAPALDLPADDR